jgi:hypothetical protein
MAITLSRIELAVEACGVPLTPRQQRVVALALLVASTPQPEPGLTPQQSALVAALRAAGGRAVSPQALMAATGAPTLSALRAVVCTLRRRCAGSGDVIETTHRPLSYRWIGP